MGDLINKNNTNVKFIAMVSFPYSTLYHLLAPDVEVILNS